MAHSLSHALMTEVALDCGYPASSLKERVYVPPRSPGEPPRAGLLIYTASAGTQVTLGGLVEVTRRFASILSGALERLALCSGDPICADHDPSHADEDRALHGAACHSCLLIAETSCEARNLHLDRSLLVDTVGPAGRILRIARSGDSIGPIDLHAAFNAVSDVIADRPRWMPARSRLLIAGALAGCWRR